MWSTVVMFVLTFAIFGLLLGIAEIYDPASTVADTAALQPEVDGSSNTTSSQESEDSGVATDD